MARQKEHDDMENYMNTMGQQCYDNKTEHDTNVEMMGNIEHMMQNDWFNKRTKQQQTHDRKLIGLQIENSMTKQRWKKVMGTWQHHEKKKKWSRKQHWKGANATGHDRDTGKTMGHQNMSINRLLWTLTILEPAVVHFAVCSDCSLGSTHFKQIAHLVPLCAWPSFTLVGFTEKANSQMFVDKI